MYLCILQQVHEKIKDQCKPGTSWRSTFISHHGETATNERLGSIAHKNERFHPTPTRHPSPPGCMNSGKTCWMCTKMHVPISTRLLKQAQSVLYTPSGMEETANHNHYNLMMRQRCCYCFGAPLCHPLVGDVVPFKSGAFTRLDANSLDSKLLIVIHHFHNFSFSFAILHGQKRREIQRQKGTCFIRWNLWPDKVDTNRRRLRCWHKTFLDWTVAQ